MNPNLSKALLKAQGQMGKLIKDSVNPHLRNKYASLTSVIETVRQPLTDSGIVLYQSASTIDGGVMVRSMLIHGDSGESVEEQLLMPIDKPTPQSIGSAITYARRYLIMLQCGLAPDDEDDDDGNKASGRTQPQPAQAQRPPQKPATNGTQHRNGAQQPQQPQTDAENAELAASVNAVIVDPALEKARKAFHAEVQTTFAAETADDITHARHWLIKRYTTKTTPDNVRESANDLAAAELTALAGVLKTHRKTYQDQWTAEKTAPIPANKQQPVAA